MRIACLIAARDEEPTIAETVTAVKGMADEVLVVDDGSRDRTGDEASAAGARVLRRSRSVGKGGALEVGLRWIQAADVWLFADGDLGSSAGGLGSLVDEIAGGRADLALAVFPPGQGGGFGLVKRAAARAIFLLSGHRSREPLSGQRAMTAACLAVCRPLASGFGVETAMLIDAARAGMRIVEIEVPGLEHRATARDLRGFAHRGKQGLDIARAVIRRIRR